MNELGILNTGNICIYCKKKLLISIEIDYGFHLDCFIKNENKTKKKSSYLLNKVSSSEIATINLLERIFKKKISISKKRIVSIRNKNKHEIYSPGFISVNGLITFLYLKEINEEFLPEIISNLKNLKELKIENSNIQFLPDNLGNLINLEKLYIINCPISTLPPSIGNLSNLEELFIYQTNLNNLPNEMENLKYLKILILDNNKLRNLPEQLKLLPLENLSILGNLISVLPDWFIELKSLKYLTISNSTQINQSIRTILESRECKIIQAIKVEKENMIESKLNNQINLILKLLTIWNSLSFKEILIKTNFDEITLNYILSKLVFFKILTKEDENYFFSNTKNSMELKKYYRSESFHQINWKLKLIYESIPNNIIKAQDMYLDLIMSYEPLLKEIYSSLIFFLYHTLIEMVDKNDI